MRPTTPATCGVAIEVPLKLPKRLPGSVDMMPAPGAATSTLVAPKFEKLASRFERSVAATEIRASSV